MRCSLFFFLGLALHFSNVVSMSIIVSPEAIDKSPTLVVWRREQNDSLDTIKFDLRFFRDNSDAGLALANIELDKGKESGNDYITFPSTGSFELIAVTGNTHVGRSNQVSIIQPNTPTSTSITVTATSSSVVSSTSTTLITSLSTSASTSPVPNATASGDSKPLGARVAGHPNLPALVGGILGALAGLALIIFLVIFIHRRRTVIRKRLTFHRDMMVQRRLSRAPTLPPLVLPRPSQTFAEDVEQGLPSGHPDANPISPASNFTAEDGHGPEASKSSAVPTSASFVGLRPALGTGHIVPSPKGPRPSIKVIGTKTTFRAIGSPLSSPRPMIGARTRRQKELGDRMAMLRRQMADLNLELDGLSMRSPASAMTAGSRPNGRAAEIRTVLDDMQRQMVWLREQEQAPWAMHMTDVMPAGHERYLRP